MQDEQQKHEAESRFNETYKRLPPEGQEREEPLKPLPLLVQPCPYRSKVEEIVHFLDTSGDGELSTAEVKSLFSKLQKVPLEDITDDHPQVVAFAGLSTEAMIDQLCVGVSEEKITEFHDALFRGDSVAEASVTPPHEHNTENEEDSLLNPRPSRIKVERIVQVLDVSSDGVVSAEEEMSQQSA